jgi:hypothetical protein
MSTFKKCKAVMLPTNEKAQNCLVGYNDGSLLFQYKPNYYYTQEYLKSIQSLAYHLYILSDDEIKDGDWFWGEGMLKPEQAKVFESNLVNGFIKSACKKIIATTDYNLLYTQERTARGEYEQLSFETGKHYANFKPTNISKPSISFINKYIEAYNTKKYINDVLVEYQEVPVISDEEYSKVESGELSYKDTNPYNIFTLKKNPKDNTITIKKVKESWTREDLPIDSLKNLIGYIDTPIGRRTYHEDVITEIKVIKKWIEENYLTENL